MQRHVAWFCAALVFACSGGDDAGGGAGGSGGSGAGSGGKPVEPVTLDPTDFTYKLTESPASIPLWTTPATRKLTTADRPPEATRSGLSLSAARNEFEPVQLVIGPAAGSVTVDVAPFPKLGAAQRVTLAKVGYVGGTADELAPLSGGGSVTLSAGQPEAVWLTVYVPEGAPAGAHETTLTVTPAGSAAVSVPVKLSVFDFDLPRDVHFATQLNVDVSSLVPNGGSVDDAKTLLFEHRMTPKSVTWPSGFNWNITWDSGSSPTKCSAIYDEPDEGAQYSIKHLSKRYILGEGWNGVGFPNAMIFQFVDNSTPRPDTFCGIARGDHFGTAAYNAEWSDFLGALDKYLGQNGLADRAYYYVQNEPQDAADDKLAAHLCRLTKAAAPGLRIAISEEPKPGIAEDPGGACGYDIWIAHVRAYQEAYAHKRIKDHGEQVWYYTLDQDPEPYFNPTKPDSQGLHSRIISWAAWSHRITGWAYYDANRFFKNAAPNIRAELLREGFEDYEYLWLANGSAHPGVGVVGIADPTAKSVAASMTSWNKNPDALMALRHELGRYIEGSRSTLPVLSVDSGVRPRGAYYVNFQDPGGQPNTDPLVVDGKTYMKVGWAAYDEKLGLGWSGQHIANPAIAQFGFDSTEGYSVVQQSYIYDDYGRDNLFEFAIEPGEYTITVGVGRPAKGYPGDPHNLSIEGQKVVDDEVTTNAAPVIERSVTMDITDGSISMVAGGKSVSTGDYAYTFLAYMHVEPAN